ncbi:tol-pal system protein YbgF [Oricola sp.]|uniref:tol-pal system protein YbgF n=1 Tax=Oricola sp. TaxID=1979950 RepID=UPI003519A316
MVSMPVFIRATFAAAALAAGGAQAAEWRGLPQGSYEVAQAADPRVYQLEEQVRSLNGKVEELTFQLLELQEQLRRNQEDNEFRFQQLEGSGQPMDGGSSTSGDAGDLAVPGATETADAAPQAAPAQLSQPVPDANVAQNSGNSSRVLGTGPRNLGTLTVDGQGNVVDGTVDFSPNQIDQAIDGEVVASVPAPEEPEAYYRSGYQRVLDGDYKDAEGIFRSFVELFPNDPLTPDARFWLAESVRAQGRPEEAVEIFIALRKAYPDMQKAPETLLKIGQIMFDLGDRDVACVTFTDAESSYPNMSATVRARISEERARAKC